MKKPNGKWGQKWVNTKCEKEKDANKVLREILVKMEKETYIEPNKILFCDFMEYYLENVIKNQIGVTAWGGYTTNIKTHIVPCFREKAIKSQDLKSIYLQRYIDEKF